MRCKDGFVVNLNRKDVHYGNWFSFTENVGGGPIKAIQRFKKLSFSEAVEYGHKLCLSNGTELKEESSELEQGTALARRQKRNSIEVGNRKVALLKTKMHNLQTELKVKTAKSMWESAGRLWFVLTFYPC